jgi:nitrate reductase NapD
MQTPHQQPRQIAPMDIASAVVYALPDRRDEVRAQLERIEGVCVHAEAPGGRFVVTVEDTPCASAADTVMALHRLAGVLAAAMVYQYSDATAPPGEFSP